MPNYKRLTSEYQASIRNFINEKRNTFVLEPAIALKFGIKNIKFHYQLVYSTFSYRDNVYPDEIFYNNLTGSLGAYLLLSNRYKKEVKDNGIK